MPVIRWLKKRCFVLSKAERAADFAWAFSVPLSPVMFAARIAASRLRWMQHTRESGKGRTAALSIPRRSIPARPTSPFRAASMPGTTCRRRWATTGIGRLVRY
ncbi:hypothetical protein DKG75_20435 [Zavarzinia compransoris]|uniref:Uncharacterized protein n=1 Tax=Zavarzinia compransoris TaxID=1264899 RepID=A0A317DUH3_9PROT|nr:hypothetical protein DKG75_20435 [Zavarzinia compransoris]